MSGGQTFLISTWISGFISFMLQLVSFCSPGWVIMDIMDTRIDMALWYVTACVTPSNVTNVSSEICHTFTYLCLFREISADGSPIQPFSYHQWVEWEAEASLALITCLVGVVLSSLACKRLRGDSRTLDFCIVRIFLLLACLAMLISGVLIMVPVGQIGKAASELSHISRHRKCALDAFTSGHNIVVGVPHSVIMAGIGGLFCMLCSALLLSLSSKTKQYQDSMNQEFVPMMPPACKQKEFNKQAGVVGNSFSRISTFEYTAKPTTEQVKFNQEEACDTRDINTEYQDNMKETETCSSLQ